MTVSSHIDFRAYIMWCKIIKSFKNEKGHVFINYIVNRVYIYIYIVDFPS